MFCISCIITSRGLFHFSTPFLSLPAAFDNSKQTAAKDWFIPF